MKHLLFLAPVVLLVAVLQASFIPAVLPVGWRPDLGLLVALCSFAFLPRGAALYFLFALGVQADLFGSARFGMLTLCDLLTAWAVLGFDRDLARGGTLGAWLAAVAGTAVAHGAYALFGAAFGMLPGFGAALSFAGERILTACIFGGAVAWIVSLYCAWMGLLSQEAAQQRATQKRRKGGWLAWAR